MTDVRAYLRLCPVIPVLTIDDPADAGPLAHALISGGLKVLEVTLRTPAALDAMRRIKDEVEGVVLAAGTVLSARDLEAAAEAGAAFAFSPGLSQFMLEPGPIAIVPGIATASEMMRGLERGLSTFKFFPAVAAGGTATLKALSAPFPDAKFCPTGGIDAEQAKKFLVLDNVLCVGGSWIAPARSIAQKDWSGIAQRARAASMLGA